MPTKRRYLFWIICYMIIVGTAVATLVLTDLWLSVD